MEQEQRLIDARKLHELICDKYSQPKWGHLFTEAAYMIATEIENAPTVDAAHVVRCGECRHHRPIDYCELHKCKGWFNDKHCSYGEPRTPPAE